MSEQLSKQDKTKVENCEYYLRTKQVMKNFEAYKDLQVGEVYFIKFKNHDKEEQYVSAGWNADPSKFIIFHKDEGFVFVKRIIASGKPGQEVMCLTTQFNVGEFWLEPDADYVNSILLQDEKGYDPFSASKKIASNKNRARRKNKKLELGFEKVEEAHEFVASLAVGDVLYDAFTTYGSGLVTWEVTKTTRRTTSKRKPTAANYSRYGNQIPGPTEEDQLHNKHGIKEVIIVEIKVKDKVLPRKRKYITTTMHLTFADFMSTCYSKYYKVKPFTVDDV